VVLTSLRVSTKLLAVFSLRRIFFSENMRLRTFAVCLILLCAAYANFLHFARAQRVHPLALRGVAGVPAPSEVIGFTPGEDRKLASWGQVMDYFDRLAKTSNRVRFERLGQTTMGRPFAMATISAPENLARLDEYRRIQDQLADPRALGKNPDAKAAELIARGKTIVLITCGIHSTEVGSTLSSMLIAYRLASSDDVEVQNILKNTIVLLVPSLNPDGVDIVKNWYDKTLGTPYEGTDPPELYHKYTGHDNNRDWYAFTQVETRITVDKIHNVWHPQIVHDIHQQGQNGSRLFLPPYMAPVEPNVPKQIVEGYTELGYFIAREMRAKGFQGITTDSTYDAWSPSRAYSHYHGGVRMLSETASCKIATPVNIKFEDLRSREGYDPQKEAPNFGPVWNGGSWGLSDITKYMTTGAFLLLRHAAENRDHWLHRFYEIGKEAIRPRRPGEINGYIIPLETSSGSIPAGTKAATLIGILQRGGVEVDRLGSNLNYQHRSFPVLSGVVRLNQPYGAFAKALLEEQQYPDLRNSSGNPIAPYDVTAHSLPLLMGVKVVPFKQSISYQKVKVGPTIFGSIGEQDFRTGLYRSWVPSMDEGWTRWMLEQAPINYTTLRDSDIRAGKLKSKFNSIVIPDQSARAILNGYAKGAMPDEYTGGLGPEGVKSLLEFVEQGGTLVFLNRACDFAIDQFKLPVKDVVAGMARSDFYVPGSILRIELDTSNSLAAGMPRESIAWAEDSPVFEVAEREGSPTPASAVKIVGRYSTEKNPLLSGWLLGADLIKGKAALVEVAMGKGRIVLFGFRPQYRAQSLATYPLFFNAIRW
jgi:hypothetical protein